MKTKKMSRKLELNKSTIANIGASTMNNVKGGTDSDFSCDTCETLWGVTCMRCNSRLSCEPDYCFQFDSNCPNCPTGLFC